MRITMSHGQQVKEIEYDNDNRDTHVAPMVKTIRGLPYDVQTTLIIHISSMTDLDT